MFCFSVVQGVPLRIEVGPRDVKAEQVVTVRRDTGEKVNTTAVHRFIGGTSALFLKCFLRYISRMKNGPLYHYLTLLNTGLSYGVEQSGQFRPN